MDLLLPKLFVLAIAAWVIISALVIVGVPLAYACDIFATWSIGMFLFFLIRRFRLDRKRMKE